MPDDIEQMLATAAHALREHELTAARCTGLERRQAEIQAELAARQAAYAAERKDADRLESLSLTRVLAALHGTRDDALAREQAEAEAARYQVAQAQARLDAVGRELAAARQRRDQLAAAPDTYAAVLAVKERQLRQSGDPRGRPLLELAQERGHLTGELGEIGEAAAAAQAALTALAQVADRLDSAASWSTYDTYFRGGMFASAIKDSRLDDAAAVAAEADQSLAVLRTELADLGGAPELAPQIAVSAGTKFVDVWFDNIFSDVATQGRIRQAQQNVAQTTELVRQVQSRLAGRAGQARARLAAIDAEREQLLC
jgi:hypothetical protein